jgi:hypothetical protein
MQRSIERIVLVGATAILCLGQFAYLLAIEPIGATGIWFQSEPVFAAVLILGAAAALLAALLGATRPARFRTYAGHPAVFLPAAAGLWSLSTAPFAPATGLALLGSPQLGQGALAFFAVASLAALAISIRRHPLLRGAVAAATGVALLLLIGLMTLGDREWQPYYYNDFLAGHALFAWMILVRWGPPAWWMRVPAGLAALLALALSDNRAALLALGAALAYGLLGWLSRARHQEGLRHALVVALPIGAILISLALPALLWSGILSRQNFASSSALASRAMLIEVVFKGFQDEPGRVLVGQGWGHYTHQLVRELRFRDVKTYLDYRSEDHMPHWDATIRVDFHSHNEPAEALMAGGLPALILQLLPLALLAWRAKPRFWPVNAAFLAALAVHQGFWFLLPITLPLMAMATATLGGSLFRPLWPRPARLAFPLAWAAIAAALTLGGLVVRSDADAARQATVHRLDAAPDRAAAACAPPFANHDRGYLHQANLIRRLGNDAVAILGENRRLRDGVTERLERYLCHAGEAAKERDGLVVAVAAIGVYSDLAFATLPDGFAPTRDRLLQGWPATLERVLAQAPARHDLAVPYFSWLLLGGAEGELSRFAGALLARNPNDPVGLWFLGITKIRLPDQAASGIDQMRRALANGLEEVMPVDAELKRQIQAWRGQ